ncbi:MAG: AraC family transcriptional regulator [Planctomycetota bacterium]
MQYSRPDVNFSPFMATSRVTALDGKTLNPDVISQLHSQLERRLGEPWTLGDMASFCFLSPFYFCRQFKEMTGITPYQYLIKLRVARAVQMFDQPQGDQPRAVAEVAYACGFSDQAHLNRHFKRIVGTTPGRYARRQIGRPRASVSPSRFEWAPSFPSRNTDGYLDSKCG